MQINATSQFNFLVSDQPNDTDVFSAINDCQFDLPINRAATFEFMLFFSVTDAAAGLTFQLIMGNYSQLYYTAYYPLAIVAPDTYPVAVTVVDGDMLPIITNMTTASFCSVLIKGYIVANANLTGRVEFCQTVAAPGSPTIALAGSHVKTEIFKIP